MSLASKTDVDNALDLEKRNKENNFKHLIQVIFLVKVIL